MQAFVLTNINLMYYQTSKLVNPYYTRVLIVNISTHKVCFKPKYVPANNYHLR